MDESLLAITPRGPWQRSLRRRGREVSGRSLALGVAVAALVTLIELAGFAVGMQRSVRTVTPDRPITITVIDLAPSEPLPPEPEPAALPARPSRVAIAPPKAPVAPPPTLRPETPTTTQGRIGPGAAAGLFNPDGSVRLPDRAPAPAAEPGNPQQAGRQRWAELQQRGENPLDCRRTRFAQAFRRDESAGDEVARKYLAWIGLANGDSIERNAGRRAERAAEGCDPAR